jgi:hypothetical protein
MTDDPIMRWENEGGALPPARSPALERRSPDPSRPETDAAEQRSSDGFRAEPANGLEGDAPGGG